MGNKSKAEDACYNPMAIRWSERYHKQLEAVWSSIPQILRSSIVTVCIVILGASLRGSFYLFSPFLNRLIGLISKCQSEPDRKHVTNV